MIPGWFIAYLTFPGVIIHEAAHLLFCKICRVPVLDVCFFRVGNPAGYVIHEEVKDFTSAFLIAVGPFLLNSLLCLVFCFPAFVPVRIFGQTDLLSYFMLWLGVSIGMHAFPSTQDAHGLWIQARRAARSLNPLALVSFPLVIGIYIANVLSVVWFDYLYGVAIGLGLPEILLRHVA